MTPVLQLGRAADHATKAAALSIFRRLVLDYAQDAIHKGAFPLQYKSGMAAEPVLQRLLSAALWCNSQELVEAGLCQACFSISTPCCKQFTVLNDTQCEV